MLPKACRRVYLLAALALLSLLGTGAGGAAPGRAEVRLLTLDGVINPLSARYVERELERARASHAEAVVIALDTPGGLERSMSEVVKAILASSVPVVVYVSPAGARAASAGMFIALAAHVAAMAPATRIGAATPVQLGGSSDPALLEKIRSDAAAEARSLAMLRGRSSDWAARAVREGVSLPVDQAIQLRVVDLGAPSLAALLRAIDGREVVTAEGSRRIHTADARVVSRPMSLFERLGEAVAVPDLAYLLLTVGFIGLLAELFHPGFIAPGVLGAICLILAFMGLGELPLNWAAALLIVLAIGLFAAELATGTGAFGLGGGIAFVLGSLLLFRPVRPVPPSAPVVHLSGWTIAAATALVLALLSFIGRSVARLRRRPVATGRQGLVGQRARVAEPIVPPASGQVVFRGERWTARSAGEERIERGAEVRIEAVEGVSLLVRPFTGIERPGGRRRPAPA